MNVGAVIWRSTHNSFEITGWGFVLIAFIGCVLREVFER